MGLQIAEKLKGGAFDGIRTVAGLKRSSYYALLLNAYEKLQTERLYVSDYHGSDHVERVMLLGAVIARQQAFTARETELLLIACSYHDIGRINDHRDERHGKRSADKLARLHGLGLSAAELRCVQAAVATHSTKDAMLDSFAEDYGVADEQMDLCRRVCRALKDADNLDRVRIRDLDTSYLRFPESKSLEKTAEAIYRLGGRKERKTTN